MPSVNPSMAFKENSQEIRIKTISVRFLLCGKNSEWAPQRVMYPRKLPSRGYFKRTLLINMDGETRVWRGCLLKGGLCCTKSCCYREGRYQRVPQTTDSITGAGNQQCKDYETPNVTPHTSQQKI